MADEIKMIYTENPYVDVMIYNLKVLAMGSIIKKDEDALKNETVETMQASDLYIECKENRIIFEMFDYPEWAIKQSTIPADIRNSCILDKTNIPVSKRQELMDIMTKYTLENYEEKNSYYRMLSGMPNVGDGGIYLSSKYELPEDIVFDASIPLHEMTANQIELLDHYGILDKIKLEYPDMKYLDYLGERKITPYTARKAMDFQLLYVPEIEYPEIQKRYKETYEKNRDFTMRTIYSEAFKFGSDYYDNFIAIFIVIQTMLDILSEIQLDILNKDIFDSRTLRYIFETYGIPYYAEIPLKYQISMIKNINTLLKYKSTNRNIIDICSLFGYDNIAVFKYYLLKDRTIDANGNYVFDPDNPNDSLCQLKFVKVPLNEPADSYIKNKNNYLNYDSITSQDPYWDGDLNHDYVKNKIMEQEFSYVRSKYISVDTLCEICNISFDLCYFYNMIFDNKQVEELLTCPVPYIKQNKAFKMTDLFCYLISLTYMYNNTEDTIMDTSDKILYVYGFNFDTDLAVLSQYLSDNKLTEEIANIMGFEIPKDSLLTYGQMLAILENNRKICDHITNQMLHAKNKRIYDIYKKLYDSLMIEKLTTAFFKKADGTQAETFTEYLQDRDAVLYTSLENTDAITDAELKRQTILNLVDQVIFQLDMYIPSSKYSAIYKYLPSANAEYIQKFVIKIIDFFKSYKTQMLGMTTIYKFDDKFQNIVQLLEKVDIESLLGIIEVTNPLEHMKIVSNINVKDKISVTDKVMIKPTHSNI